MCGIAGYSGDFEPGRLRLFGAALSHRGPDDSGRWLSVDRRIGLVHRRLSIIDLSPAGRQPMTDDTGNVVVFNGEIYNYRELRRELENDGHRFRSQSDTEVLLRLYGAYGEVMLPRLNGIYAFAIFDRSRDSVLLACDPMAVKPLYVSEGAKGVVFASELKALLLAGVVDCALDVTALYRTLGFLWSPGGSTPLRNVKRLGPGDALTIRRGRIDRAWHWASSPFREEAISQRGDEVAEHLRGALRTAVHRQMVSDVPVGAFLSGGLDSSAIVAMARDVDPGIQCFTIDTGTIRDAGVTDDLPYARRVARHLGVRLHEVRVDAGHMARDLESMIVQLDEPLADPAPLNVLFIARLAASLGIKVLLSGAGGDDVLSGYRRHRALTLERYWSWLPRSIRATLRRAAAGLDQRTSAGRRLARLLARADAPAQERLAGAFLWADPQPLHALFAPDHRAGMNPTSMLAPLVDYLDGLPRGLDRLQQMLALEQRFFLPDHNLLYTDKMSMAAGVEVRVPFLDDDVVRYANRLPSGLKQRGLTGKWVLKRAFEASLPHDVVHRPKTGFGAPVRRWLRNELRDVVEDTLSPASVRRRGLFDEAAVSRLVEDDRSGRIDGAYVVLSLVCIELWCRNFLTRSAPGVPFTAADGRRPRYPERIAAGLTVPR